MFTETTKKIALVGFMVFGLAACGEQSTDSILKDVEYRTFQQDNEVFVTLKTELDTQNIIVSAASLPIYDKKNPDRLLGQVDVATDLETMKSTLSVTLNTTISLNLPEFTFSSKLPNGLPIPVSGIDMNRVIAFDVGDRGSKVYIYYNQMTKKAVLGVALNIESLSIGTPASIFAAYDQNNIRGLAGFYFGNTENTSGVGVFANLTGLFQQTSAKLSSVQKASAEVQFIPVNNYQEVKHLIDWKFFKLQKSQQPLIVK